MCQVTSQLSSVPNVLAPEINLVHFLPTLRSQSTQGALLGPRPGAAFSEDCLRRHSWEDVMYLGLPGSAFRIKSLFFHQ